MLHIRPLYQPPGIETVLVGIGRALDTVGIKDNGAGEMGEFLGLILPGPAKVAGQVRVFFEAGIAMGRKHLTVGVDVDPFAFGLLEEFLQHLEVVAGDQNSFAGPGTQIDRGWDRCAIGLVVSGVQKTHGGQVLLAAFQTETDKVHQAEVGVGGCGQRLLEECHDVVIALTQDHGVIHIGSHPFQPEYEDFDHGTNIFVDMPGVDAVLLSLSNHAGEIVSGFPLSHRSGNGGTGSGLGLFLQLVAFLNHSADGRRIKIDVGDRGEEHLNGKTVDFGIAAKLVGIQGQGLQAEEQMVLQGCHVRLLAADA